MGEILVHNDGVKNLVSRTDSLNIDVSMCTIFLQALYLLLSSEMLSEISLRGNVSLTLTCSKSLSYCFNIFCKGENIIQQKLSL